jgi:hypothetical protein
MSRIVARRLGDLQPIHAPGINPVTEQKLRRLTDDELMRTVTHPRNGQVVKVKPGGVRLMDGNTRVREMQRRLADPHSTFKPDTIIPVEEVN